MIIAVDITRTADGITRRHALLDCERDAPHFMWTEGNYGCDCNRHLFFERAGGIDPHDAPDYWDNPPVSCSEARYSAAFVHDDGTVEPIGAR